MADVADTIEDSGRRIGRHAWAEMRMFEVLGGWSGTVAEPRTRALLAETSRHHAWHAELWHDLLPDLPHLPAADLVAPDEPTAAIVTALEAVDGTDARATLAAVHEGALPHLADRYAEHLERTTPVTDGPTIRALRLVLADIEGDGTAAGDLLGALRAEAPG
jgi:hypothetical protein